MYISAIVLTTLLLVVGGACVDAEKVSEMESVQVSAIVPVQDRPLELSGCAVVDGGLLVVEDELVGSVLFISALDETPLVVSSVKLERKKKSRKPYAPADKLFPIQDFEDIASDGSEAVYLLGSHQGKGGERRPDREFLLAAKWDEKQEELKVVGEQYQMLESVAPILERAGVSIGISGHAVNPDVNFEGLAYDGERLYLGLRGPQTVGGEAVVLSARADGLFRAGATPSWSVVTLPLKGAGIRALDWDRQRNHLWVVSGPSSTDTGEAALWRVAPNGSALVEVHQFTGEVARKAPEGVCRLPESKGGGLLVVLDGGGVIRMKGI